MSEDKAKTFRELAEKLFASIGNYIPKIKSQEWDEKWMRLEDHQKEIKVKDFTINELTCDLIVRNGEIDKLEKQLEVKKIEFKELSENLEVYYKDKFESKLDAVRSHIKNNFPDEDGNLNCADCVSKNLWKEGLVEILDGEKKIRWKDGVDHYCPCAGTCHTEKSPCSFDCLNHHTLIILDGESQK